MGQTEYVRERMKRIRSLHESQEMDSLLALNSGIANLLLSKAMPEEDEVIIFSMKLTLDSLITSHRERLKKSKLS